MVGEETSNRRLPAGACFAALRASFGAAKPEH